MASQATSKAHLLSKLCKSYQELCDTILELHGLPADSERSDPNRGPLEIREISDLIIGRRQQPSSSSNDPRPDPLANLNQAWQAAVHTNPIASSSAPATQTASQNVAGRPLRQSPETGRRLAGSDVTRHRAADTQTLRRRSTASYPAKQSESEVAARHPTPQIHNDHLSRATQAAPSSGPDERLAVVTVITSPEGDQGLERETLERLNPEEVNIQDNTERPASAQSSPPASRRHEDNGAHAHWVIERLQLAAEQYASDRQMREEGNAIRVHPHHQNGLEHDQSFRDYLSTQKIAVQRLGDTSLFIILPAESEFPVSLRDIVRMTSEWVDRRSTTSSAGTQTRLRPVDSTDSTVAPYQATQIEPQLLDVPQDLEHALVLESDVSVPDGTTETTRHSMAKREGSESLSNDVRRPDARQNTSAPESAAPDQAEQSTDEAPPSGEVTVGRRPAGSGWEESPSKRWRPSDMTPQPKTTYDVIAVPEINCDLVLASILRQDSSMHEDCVLDTLDLPDLNQMKPLINDFVKHLFDTINKAWTRNPRGHGSSSSALAFRTPPISEWRNIMDSDLAAMNFKEVAGHAKERLKQKKIMEMVIRWEESLYWSAINKEIERRTPVSPLTRKSLMTTVTKEFFIEAEIMAEDVAGSTYNGWRKYFQTLSELREQNAPFFVLFRPKSWISFLQQRSKYKATTKELVKWHTVLAPMLQRMIRLLEAQNEGDFTGRQTLSNREADIQCRWSNITSRWTGPEHAVRWTLRFGTPNLMTQLSMRSLLRWGYRGNSTLNFSWAMTSELMPDGTYIAFSVVDVPQGAFIGIIPGRISYDPSSIDSIPAAVIRSEVPGLWLDESCVVGHLTWIQKVKDNGNVIPAWDLYHDAGVPNRTSLRVLAFADRIVPAFQRLRLVVEAVQEGSSSSLTSWHLSEPDDPTCVAMRVGEVNDILCQAHEDGHEVDSLAIRYWSPHLGKDGGEFIAVRPDDAALLRQWEDIRGLIMLENQEWVQKYQPQYQQYSEKCGPGDSRLTLYQFATAAIGATAREPRPYRAANNNTATSALIEQERLTLENHASSARALEAPPRASLPDSTPKGIVNLGQTCFLGCAVQFLKACKPLALLLSPGHLSGYVLERDWQLTQDASPHWAGIQETLKRFPRVLANMLHSVTEASSIDPRELLESCRLISPQWSAGQPQDSEEAISTILRVLWQVLRSPSKVPRMGQQPSQLALSLVEQRDIAWLNVQVDKLASPVMDIFFGLFATAVWCGQCNNPSGQYVFESFHELSLPIISQDSSPPVTLTSLVDALFAETDVEHTCTHCGSRQGRQQRRIARLPKYIILHIGRFTQRLGKCVRQVELPTDFSVELSGHCLSEALDADGDPTRYSICAAIYHQGSRLNEGHYTCTAKHGNEWFEFDDENVGKVANMISQDLHKSIYMLLLKRSV